MSASASQGSMQNGTHDNGVAHNAGGSPSAKAKHSPSQSGSDRTNLLALATPNLESRLSLLRSQSTNLSTTLTQRLATSQSGQNLLHIGPSLQSLPPDLHSLLRNLRPILGEVEKYESLSRDELIKLVDKGNEIRGAVKKVREAGDCAMIYGDLCRSEEEVRRGGSAGAGAGKKSGDKFGTGAKRSGKFGGEFKTPSKKGGVDGSGMMPSSEMVVGGLDDWSDDAMEGCAGKLIICYLVVVWFPFGGSLHMPQWVNVDGIYRDIACPMDLLYNGLLTFLSCI